MTRGWLSHVAKKGFHRDRIDATAQSSGCRLDSGGVKMVQKLEIQVCAGDMQRRRKEGHHG